MSKLLFILITSLSVANAEASVRRAMLCEITNQAVRTVKDSSGTRSDFVDSKPYAAAIAEFNSFTFGDDRIVAHAVVTGGTEEVQFTATLDNSKVLFKLKDLRSGREIEIEQQNLSSRRGEFLNGELRGSKYVDFSLNFKQRFGYGLAPIEAAADQNTKRPVPGDYIGVSCFLSDTDKN